MAESNAAFGEVVRGKFEGDFIAGEDPNTVAAETACEMCQNKTFMLQLDTEFTAGEFLDYSTLYFYAVFFTHSFVFTLHRSGAGRFSLVGLSTTCPAPHRELARDRLDVRRLQTLGSAGHFELNARAFIERTVAARLNRRKVDENILARLALDEAETLGCIKPLHCTFFFHYKTSLKKSQPVRIFGILPVAQKNRALAVLAAQP